MALVVRQLEVVVHLERGERAVLGAQSTVHADIHVDVKILGQRDDRSLGALCLRHPDALGRADLGADVAGGASDVAVLGVINEDRQHAEPLVDRQSLVRVLDREEPIGLEILLHRRLAAPVRLAEKVHEKVSASASTEPLPLPEITPEGEQEPVQCDQMTADDALTVCHRIRLLYEEMAWGHHESRISSPAKSAAA